MKWRVILAVCFVLLLFAAFAYLYVNTFVRKHQHAVILFVVDGLDLNTLAVARQQLGAAAGRADPDDPLMGDARRQAAYRGDLLNLDSFWNLALLNLQDPGRPVPDAGVDATALACGQRVDNGYVAMNERNEALRSLVYEAEQAQRATGLVTTSSLVDPTTVAFYSNTKGVPEPYRNAEDLTYSGINVILGGGSAYFLPASVSNEWGRTDGRNLVQEAGRRGYTVVRSRDDLRKLSTWRIRQVLGLFASGGLYFSALQPERSQQPSLADMTRVAISSLNYSINGYFLVVTHGLVARASEQNFGKLAVDEVAEVDEAIQTAVAYAGPDALVLVTNSYNLGATGPLPPAPAGLPEPMGPPVPTAHAKTEAVAISTPPPTLLSVGWLAGPGGPPGTPAEQEWLRQRAEEGWFSTNAPGLLQPQGALRFEMRAMPLAGPAWIASRGEGSTQFRGFLNNTDVFNIISEQF